MIDVPLLVVSAHPYRDSFSRAVANALSEAPRNRLLELYKESFEPVLTRAELTDYVDGPIPATITRPFHKLLERSRNLALVFPVWWGGPPAIMKGFFDRVLLPSWAFHIAKDGSIRGGLTWIESAHVFCTLDSPDAEYTRRTVSAMQQILGETTFGFCGVQNLEWHVLDRISARSDKERVDWVESARILGRRLAS